MGKWTEYVFMYRPFDLSCMLFLLQVDNLDLSFMWFWSPSSEEVHITELLAAGKEWQ